MSVIIFPRRHAGERQPGVGVIHLPGNIASISRSLVLSGLDASTAAAVEAELDVLEGAIDEANKSCDRIVELLRPFTVEGAQ